MTGAALVLLGGATDAALKAQEPCCFLGKLKKIMQSLLSIQLHLSSYYQSYGA